VPERSLRFGFASKAANTLAPVPVILASPNFCNQINALSTGSARRRTRFSQSFRVAPQKRRPL
jgi:hypothetical protein